jgi:hypothetical protein
MLLRDILCVPFCLSAADTGYAGSSSIETGDVIDRARELDK